MMDAHNKHATTFKSDKIDTNEYGEPNHNAMIERLALEPIASDDTSRNWADEVENHIGLELQDEYMAPNYSALPAPPSPAPWYPPPPPTSKYKPPPAHTTHPPGPGTT